MLISATSVQQDTNSELNSIRKKNFFFACLFICCGFQQIDVVFFYTVAPSLFFDRICMTMV